MTLFGINLIQCSSYSGGSSNRLYRCSIKGVESSHVLLRLYGSDSIPIELLLRGRTEAQLLALVMMMSVAVNGPRLLAVFDGGRIEEYIPSRVLTRPEITYDPINKIIARKMARIHALEAPISKTPLKISEVTSTIYKDFLEHKSILITKIPPEDIDLAKKVLDFDLGDQLNWFFSVAEKVETKNVFTHQDLHLNNILVRLAANNNEISDDDIVIIDFDSAFYGQRCTELGPHFTYRSLDWTKRNIVRDNGSATLEEKKVFIAEYLNETKAIAVSKGQELNPIDSFDHLMLELELFEMGAYIIIAVWVLRYRDPTDVTFALWVSN